MVNENRINASGQEKINRLNRELAENKRALEEFRRQSQIRKNASQRQMEAYMEQLLK